MVNCGFTLQSSVKYRSYTDCRKYLSGLPNEIALVSGIPSRKSARSDPVVDEAPPLEELPPCCVAAPVNANPPRGFCCERTLYSCRRKSPPKTKLCRR